MTTNYKQLETIFKKDHAMNHLYNLAGWDEAVMMPSGSGEARADAMSELSGMMVENLQNPKNQEWLNKAQSEQLDSWQSTNLLEMKRIISNANALSVSFVKRKVKTNMQAEQAWRTHRKNNDWKSFAPHLEEVFSLVKEEAAIRADLSNKSQYDALLALYQTGISSEEVDVIFQDLKQELPQILEGRLEKQKSMNFPELKGPFSIDKQKHLGQKIMQDMGIDFNRARLDISHHPFCGGSPEDVRLTTRYSEDNFTESLMGIIHESGHARYEQEIPRQWLGQPVGASNGMAVHEGQSLFFEMQMGRDAGFIRYALPLMKDIFHEQVNEQWTLENMTNLYQKVEPGFIRVDADEVTYPFHVMLRYELEKDILANNIAVKDLPEAWNAKMVKYLGLTTLSNDKDGVMQDVHWPSGAFGYFPTYTLGAIVASQLFMALEKFNPAIRSEIAQGQFQSANLWLKENVWSQGSYLPLQELLLKATGEKLNGKYLINHLKNRYL